MTSPLAAAANPRAIAPQQRPVSPSNSLPPPSLPQQSPHHTTIPALHPPNIVPLVSSSSHNNTTSPAVASLGVTPAAPSNGAATTTYSQSIPMAAYPQTQPSYPPLYTPYLNHSPYLSSPAVPSPSHSASSRVDVVSFNFYNNHLIILLL